MSDAVDPIAQRALAINIDRQIYGTFAEIGAGQEVARWFFSVGGAAGTVAKSMSAYDMQVSDAIYGKASRYVSRERLEKMLDHEYSLLQERLRESRGGSTRFFAFADTAAAKAHAGGSDWHAWMGHDATVRPPLIPGHEFAGMVAAEAAGTARPTRIRAVFAPIGWFVLNAARPPAAAPDAQSKQFTAAVEIVPFAVMAPERQPGKPGKPVVGIVHHAGSVVGSVVITSTRASMPVAPMTSAPTWNVPTAIPALPRFDVQALVRFATPPSPMQLCQRRLRPCAIAEDAMRSRAATMLTPRIIRFMCITSG